MSAKAKPSDQERTQQLAGGKQSAAAYQIQDSGETLYTSGVVSGGGLPQGWRRVAIRDMADSIQYGHTASAIERIDGPRFLRITDIQDGRVDWSAVPSCEIPRDEIPKYRLFPGDLVFARTGATTGKSFLIGDCPEAVFASYLIRVRVSAEVDSRYLSAFFQSPDYWRQIEGGKRGIGQPNVNGKVLGEVQFPVAPIPEQRRIVAEIEKQFTRLEVGVAALKRVQANLKRYRAAVLKAACEGRLVPTEAELAKAENRKFETGEELLARILEERRKSWKGRGANKEPSIPGSTSLGLIPNGWARSNIGHVGEVGTGATPNRGNQEYFSGGSIPWVTSGSVNDRRVEDTDQFVTSAALEQCNLTVYPPGTLLLAMYGEGKTRGMASELGISAATNQALAAIQTQDEIRGFIKIAAVERGGRIGSGSFSQSAAR